MEAESESPQVSDATLLNAAVAYGAQGIAIMPCAPRGKSRH